MILLKDRGIIEVSGNDAGKFLDNILTNNTPDKGAVYAALLGPQGKFLFDIFILAIGDGSYLLDCNNSNELFAKLSMYKLRSDVKIMDKSNELAVYFDTKPHENFFNFEDCRTKNFGYRIFAPIKQDLVNPVSYDKIRISKNIPEPAKDLIRDKDFALEGRLDEMGAIDFHKGCYIGQEMTSRMKRRGTLKQKLQSFSFNGAPPDYDSPILAENLEIGRTRSLADNIGMALIRFDRLNDAAQNNKKLLAGETEIFIDTI